DVQGWNDAGSVCDDHGIYGSGAGSTRAHAVVGGVDVISVARSANVDLDVGRMPSPTATNGRGFMWELGGVRDMLLGAMGDSSTVRFKHGGATWGNPRLPAA